MTLILQGTDNSVSSPAVQGGTAGTTTGVYYPASNQVALATNGTLALIVDSSQKIGIGTASPTDQLTITGSVAGNVNVALSNQNATGYAEYRVGNLGASGKTYYIGSAGSTASSPYAGNFYVYDGTASTNCLIANRYGIGVGAATPSSGTGLTFPASQNASSDVNTLDDYEEGTWTPTFTSTGTAPTLTYGNRPGTYTKIGRMVYITCQINTASLSGGSGYVYISGLPFNSSFSTWTGVGCGYFNATGGSNATSVMVASGAINLSFWANTTQLVWGSYTSLDLYFTIAYQAS